MPTPLTLEDEVVFMVVAAKFIPRLRKNPKCFIYLLPDDLLKRFRDQEIGPSSYHYKSYCFLLENWPIKNKMNRPRQMRLFAAKCWKASRSEREVGADYHMAVVCALQDEFPLVEAEEVIGEYFSNDGNYYIARACLNY